MHLPIFESRRANSAFQLLLTCAYGFPVSEFLPGHNLSHHRHVQKPADLMRTSKAPFVRFNVLNLVYFFPRVAMDILTQNYRYVRVMKRRDPSWSRQLLLEALACWGSKAVLLAVDWRRALAFVLVPHLWALWGITTTNFLQHDGCDEDDPVNHSRNFVGKAFNWITFNNGFHGAHHDRPALHWSLLPAAHAERFHGRVNPELEQKSLLAYLLRTFVLSPRRVRHDGTPARAVCTTRDGIWIPDELAPRKDEPRSAA
jgi:fatty acid desaturase